jgi:hypothetical protein
MRRVIWTDFLSAVKVFKQAVRQFIVKPISVSDVQIYERIMLMLCVRTKAELSDFLLLLLEPNDRCVATATQSRA